MMIMMMRFTNIAAYNSTAFLCLLPFHPNMDIVEWLFVLSGDYTHHPRDQ